MSSSKLAQYLQRPLTAPAGELLDAISQGPIDPALALAETELDRLLDPAPMAAETGWCWLPGGVGYVAVRTAMPAVSGEMLDWWFEWHADDPLRYRIWHPHAHKGNSIERPRGTAPRAKAHWDTVHHPVEDVGIGVSRVRIEFVRPTAIGFSTDALSDPRVATIVCGYAGDDGRRVRHSPMVHVALRAEAGVVMRSRFWMGAALRPDGPLGSPGARLLNNPLVRRAVLPRALPAALATHCAEEYANLAALLPELWREYGPN